MNRLQRLQRDERGMSYVLVGMGMTAFLSASILAIDVGMLMTARNQAQNSADAGALAGATALAFDDFDNRSASGPAAMSAMTAATANKVIQGDVSVTGDDVEFFNGPSGEARVRVTVYRNAERSNPLETLMATILRRVATGDMATTVQANIAATAVAEVSPADGMTCVKPFTIPDRWQENTNPPWSSNSTFETHTKKGDPLPNPDVYIPATDKARYTGYNQERDRGTRLMIRAGSGNDINPSFYFSLAIGGVTGGQEYRWNIANCNTHVMKWGDPLVQEPGNMMGPTVQGVQALIDQDPGAFWNTATNRVAGSAFGSAQSPRVFPIPLYDPNYYSQGVLQGRFADLKVANWIGFFAEEIVGNNVYGRIIPIAGIRTGSSDVPEGLFPMVIRLIE